MLSLVPKGLQSLWIECQVEGPTDGPRSLLSYLAQLQHLTNLSLELPGPNWPHPGPAYSALTASSILKSPYMFTPPVGVWSHVFPAGRVLPTT